MIHPTCQIHPTARIECEDITIGPRAIIRPHVFIEGRSIKIGTEAYIDEYAHIGGGSCYDETSKLVAGDWLHLGKGSHLNQGMGMTIGHEFGCGGGKVFTHGAYQSALDGFPVEWGSVTIGNNVWIPFAWVTAGITIGDNVVVSAMSLVNRSLPSGCLAGGIPVKILRENAYPKELSPPEKAEILRAICKQAVPEEVHLIGFDPECFSIHIQDTHFFLSSRKIEGPVTEVTERLKNQLRRNGIRFRYYNCDGVYKAWE